MKGQKIHFALREMTSTMRAPAVWIGMFAATLILGLSGPFDTIDVMRFLPRIGYWGLIVVVTFSTGAFVGNLVFAGRDLDGRHWHWVILLAGLVTGLAVAFEVLLINWLAIGMAPDDVGYVATLAINTLVISVVVSGLLALNSRQPTETSTGPTRLLSRLNFEKRGSLISMSVQDHYVEVTTTKGQDLLLMRLSDAIAETDGVEGWQVHRSHWVAADAVAKARRNGNKATLILTDGREIPVSRTYMSVLKDAGVL